jgi:hypothetical protein
VSRIQPHVDISVLKRFVAAGKQGVGVARRQGVRTYVQLLMSQVGIIAPRDTGRYVRAWYDAANQTNAVNLALPVINASKYEEEYAATLAEALRRAKLSRDYFEKRLDVLYPNGVPKRGDTPAFRQLTAGKRRAAKRIETLARYLDNFEKASGTSIVIGGLFRGKGKLKPKVSHRVYGGRGQILDGANKSVVVLVNKEPHANLVERRYKVLNSAQSRVRGSLFLRRERGELVKQLTRARKASGA